MRIADLPVMSVYGIDEDPSRVKRNDPSDSERNRLVMEEDNQNILVWVAGQFRNRGLPMADLIQSGQFGLLRAAQEHDPSRGAKFTSYATRVIRSEIQEWIRTTARPIVLTRRATNDVRSFLDARTALVAAGDPDPSDDEVMTAMGVTTPKRIVAVSLAIRAIRTRFTSFPVEDLSGFQAGGAA